MPDEFDPSPILRDQPTVYGEARPLLYRADGVPLTRAIGFGLQTTRTFPEAAKTANKGGKKR